MWAKTPLEKMKMSGSLKLGLMILAAVVAFYVLGWLLKSLLTIAVIAGVVLVVVGLVASSRRALSGSRRFLP